MLVLSLNIVHILTLPKKELVLIGDLIDDEIDLKAVNSLTE